MVITVCFSYRILYLLIFALLVHLGSSNQACVANRNAATQAVEDSFGWACGQTGPYNCDEIPEDCKADSYAIADWVFSRYFAWKNTADSCNFNGAAMLATPEAYQLYAVDACVELPPTTTTSAWPAVPTDVPQAVIIQGKPRPTEVIKGVSYGPVPLRSPQFASQLPQDDWMTVAAKPMWGAKGRADLKVIKALGSNAIRLYGNGGENNHAAFLDEAYREGLKVTPGLSDYPFTQMSGSCKETNYDCYHQIMESYLLNLKNGFLTQDNEYHPALEYMILINEPDLKLPFDAMLAGNVLGARNMCKAIVSAFDAVLDAEREAGLVGVGINFTATFSFATCLPCYKFNRKPALAQMAQLADAMQHPDRYGYAPRNDLAEAFRVRWINSFNTQNAAGDLPALFFESYHEEFQSTPVFIGEYHKPHIDQEPDLVKILEFTSSFNLFLGISFFQFMKAYWKGGSEEEFGAFELGPYTVAEMNYFGKTYDIDCLVPVVTSASAIPLPAAIAAAYGGPYLNAEQLCIPNPAAVELRQSGYAIVHHQQDVARMSTFVTRVAQHFGADVTNSAGLEAFAKTFLDSTSETFESMATKISLGNPAWLFKDTVLSCVADRDAFDTEVSAAVAYVCGDALGPDCNDVPDECKGDIYSSADWIFAHWYQAKGNTGPLENCYFDGAGILASSALRSSWKTKAGCAQVVGTIATVTSTFTSTTTTKPNCRDCCTTTSCGSCPGYTVGECGSLDCISGGNCNKCCTKATTALEEVAARTTTTVEEIEEVDQSMRWGCYSNRDASTLEVVEATNWACGLPYIDRNFSCADVPAACKDDPFRTGDWIFSNWYQNHDAVIWENCNFNGAATFGNGQAYMEHTLAVCVNSLDSPPAGYLTFPPPIIHVSAVQRASTTLTLFFAMLGAIVFF